MALDTVTDKRAALKMSKARTALVLDNPWFGSLALRLRVVENLSIPTMATDGTSLHYNPAFVHKISDAECIGVQAHEVMHCALLHPYRKGGRNHKDWNIATDYAINQLIIDGGMQLPKQGLLDARFKGMAAEQIYTILAGEKKQNQEQGKAGQGEGNDKWDIGGCDDGNAAPKPDDGQGAGKGKGQGKPQQGAGGEPGDTPDGQGQAPDDRLTESDWEIAVAQAARIASAAGKLPGHIQIALAQSRESVTDWRAILRRFLESTHASDYTWTRPNRRLMGQGFYLPGVHKENVGVMVIGVDTSGSIYGPLLEQFSAEIGRIIEETKPERTYVVYCDTRVTHVQEFEPDGDEFKIEAKGGGGTLFQPVFDWVRDNGVDPKALIYLTDLECFDAPVEPAYPVLWVTPDPNSVQTFPWGEVVRVRIED